LYFVDRIFSIVWDISDWFYEAYRIARDWWWPFDLLASPLRYISDYFWDLLTPISHLGDWIEDVVDTLQNILTFSNIWSYFKDWFQWAEWAYDWVRTARSKVDDIVNTWWSSTQQAVISWVNEAKAYALSLFTNLQSLLGSLQSTWDDFITQTLPNLADWTGIQSMINTTLSIWFPFYNELTSLWSEIKKFFVDPLQYIYDKLDEFFERFW